MFFRNLFLNRFERADNGGRCILLKILLQLLRINTDIAKSRSLGFTHRAAFPHRTHESFDTGSGDFGFGAGSDNRSSKGCRLGFSKTRNLTQCTITLKHFTNLLGLCCVVITQKVSGIGKLVRFIERQAHTGLPFRHHGPGFFSRHIKGNGHLGGLFRKGRQVFSGNPRLTGSRRDLSQAISRHRNASRHFFKVCLKLR